jgi:hypothetical protein
MYDASPIPANPRVTANCPTDRTKPDDAAATHQTAADEASSRVLDIRSPSHPNSGGRKV